jgi:hypothetical protein
METFGGGMPSRYDELKAMAEDCRRLAAATEEEHIRFQLLAVAEHFERLAEQHVRTSPKSPPKS